MRRERLRRLPVIDPSGLLQGMITLNDLLRAARETNGSPLLGVSYEDVIMTLMAMSVREGKPMEKAAASSLVIGEEAY
jgi:CBS domain-containing protein